MTERLPALLLVLIFVIAAILISMSVDDPDHELKVRTVKTLTYATDDLIDAEYLRK